MPAQFVARFGQAAQAYNTYRPEYPSEIFEHILSCVPSDRRRAMDLGAGTGRATFHFVGNFAEMIAVEPDTLMAEKICAQDPRVVVRVSTAEDCVQPPTSVDLVTIANALHWMDGPRVMNNVVLWLRPGGILAVIDPPYPGMPDPVRAVVLQEVEERWNAFRDPRLGKFGDPEEGRYQNLIRRTPGLALFGEKTFTSTIHATPADFVGFWSSTSYGSAYARSLSDPNSYWRGLESRSRNAWPEEKFPLDFSPLLLLAKRVETAHR